MSDARQHGTTVGRVGLVGALVVALPVVLGVAYSIAASVGVAGAGASTVSLERVTRVLSAASTWKGLLWTLWVAFASTAIALAVAVVVAVTFRGARPVDRIGRMLATLPLTSPYLVAAALGVWILGQSGMIARLLAAMGVIQDPAQMPALIYDRAGAGLILTLAWKEAAFFALVASSLLATRTRAAEEAARTLGATVWDTLRRVTWPTLWRGMLPAAVAVFTFVAGSYEAAVLLAPSDPLALPLLMADRAADPDLARRGDAYVVALLLFCIGGLVVAAHERVSSKWGATAG